MQWNSWRLRSIIPSGINQVLNFKHDFEQLSNIYRSQLTEEVSYIQASHRGHRGQICFFMSPQANKGGANRETNIFIVTGLFCLQHLDQLICLTKWSGCVCCSMKPSSEAALMYQPAAVTQGWMWVPGGRTLGSGEPCHVTDRGQGLGQTQPCCQRRSRWKKGSSGSGGGPHRQLNQA